MARSDRVRHPRRRTAPLHRVPQQQPSERPRPVGAQAYGVRRNRQGFRPAAHLPPGREARYERGGPPQQRPQRGLTAPQPPGQHHGRADMGGPPVTAWELARAWPGAELIVIEDSGHTGSTGMRDALDSAAERLYAAITASAAA